MRQERQEKVWSVRGSIKGRRWRRQEEKATAGAGTGLWQREWMEGGGEGEGQRQDAEGETQETQQRGGKRKEGEEVGKGFSRGVPAARRPVKRAVVVGSFPTNGARRAHLKTSIVHGLGL